MGRFSLATISRKSTLVSISLLLLLPTLHAEDLHWVGGSGKWHNAEHWAFESGGSGGAGIPTPDDDVVFDAASGPSSGYVVRLQQKADARTIDMKAVSAPLTLKGDQKGVLNVHGSLHIPDPVQVELSGKVVLRSDDPGERIETGKKTIRSDLVFNGNGQWDLSLPLKVASHKRILLKKGHLRTNGKKVSCGAFITRGNAERTLELGNSRIVLERGWIFNERKGLDFRAQDSRIIFNQEVPAGNVELGRLQYNKVTTNRSKSCELDNGDSITIDIVPDTTYNSCPTGNPCEVSCAGGCDGRFTVEISGNGSGDYDYSWSGTGDDSTDTDSIWTGVCDQNSISLTVTDNQKGGTCLDNEFVDVPFDLTTTNFETTPATCHDSCDGEATHDPAGGITPYEYQWFTDSVPGETTKDADSLCSGPNQLKITDANGCTFDTSVTINPVTAITSNVTVDSTTCFNTCDGGATANPEGGGGSPWDYTWGNGDNTKSTSGVCGDVDLHLVDSLGCPYDTTVTIPSPLEIQIDTTDKEDLLCYQECTGSISVNVQNGSPPYSYEWYNANTGDPLNPQQDSSTATGLCAESYYVVVTDKNNCEKTSDTISLSQPPELVTDSTSSDSMSCHNVCDGRATVTPEGGTPDYDYDWFFAATDTAINQTDSIATGLCPGDYYAVVSDANGCVDTSSLITVESPDSIKSSISGKDAICSGGCSGEAEVSPSGGSPGYDIEWFEATKDSAIGQNGTKATNLCAGDYYAVITDSKGCMDTSDVQTINDPPPILTDEDSINVSCFGNCDGEVSVAVSQGTAPYDIEWFDLNTGNKIDSVMNTNNGDTTTSLCPSAYYAVVTDANGCVKISDTITIDQPDSLESSVKVEPQSCPNSCDAWSLTNISGGTAPYDTVWYDNGGTIISDKDTLMNLCAGDYSVAITDSNGCKDSTAFTIDQPDSLKVAIDSTVNDQCGGDCEGEAYITVTGGSTPYQYEWWDAQGDTAIGVNIEDPDSLCKGEYYVKVTSNGGCTVLSDTIKILEIVGIDPNTNSSDVTCSGFCDGSVWADPNGGNQPYKELLWTNPAGDTIGFGDSLTGMCSGDYILTITDNEDCQSEADTITVGAKQEIILSTDSVDVLCNGDSNGTAIVTPSGGTQPYDYQWDASTGGQTDSMATGLPAGTYDVTVTDDNGCTSDTSVTVNEPPALSWSLSESDVTCNGECSGKASVSVTGGNPSYDHEWRDEGNNLVATDDSISGLCPGKYYITVSDSNNCSFRDSINITEPSPFSASIDKKVNNACPGDCNGSATVEASGGVTPYSYAWTDPDSQNTKTADDLCAGTYDVTVTDANGCDTTLSVTITAPDSFDLSTSVTDVSCSGDCDGEATVTVKGGGTSPYDHHWNDPLEQKDSTAKNLCAGTYTDTVTDANGCDTLVTITVDEPASLSLSISKKNPTCPASCDGEFDANVNGGSTPYQYSWVDLSTGDEVATKADPTGLCDGTYKLTVTDSAGCTLSKIDSLVAPDPITADFDITKATCGMCDGSATANVSGGNSGYSYQWNDPSNQTGPTATGLCPGIYDLTVTDDSGCTETFTIPISNDGAEDTRTDSVMASCNDSCDGKAMVEIIGGCSDPPCSINWLDSAGNTLSNPSPDTLKEGLCAGLYFAEVTNNTGCVKFDSVLVPEPDPIAPNDSVTHASCKDSCDGVAWVSPTGGTPGYDYSWTGGVNNPNDSLNTDLCAGNYDITISDANNCDTTRTITVAEPDSLDLADISVTDISCNGADDGSIIIFPDGGTPGYSYQWIDCSTGSPIGQNGQKATNLSPGDYSVIVNDTNGCQKVSECVTVNEPASLTADASVMNNVTCNGDCDGSARVDVNGGTPNYTYEWFDGAGNPVSGGDTTITGLCAGDYYVKVTDVNGCSILSDTVTVTEPAPITLNTDKRDNACNGDCEGMAIVMATGGIPGYNYQWMDAATGNPITGATDDTLRNACAGPYVAKVTDMNGCKELSDTIRIDEPDPLTLNKGSDDISCKDSCDGKVFVDPSGGTPPYSVFWDNGSTADTLDDLCPGTYTVQVTDANGCITIDSITLIEPKPLTATLNADSSTCGDCDGVAEVLPTGGNPSPGYSYEWSPSGQTDQVADSLCAGPHWVQVTAMGSGCRDTFQTTVSDIGSEKLSTDSVDASCEDICDGMAIADFNCTDPGCSIQWFDANTGNPISSATDDTLRNACDGEYFVEVVNNSGCKAVEFVTVGSPVIEANESITSASCKGICDGQISINPSGGAGNYSYQWTDNNGDPMAPQDPENPTGLCKGTYKVVITDAVGCDSTYTFTVPGPPAITGKFSTTNANCGLSDGTATLSNISGGNGGPYGVTWFDDNMDSLNQTGNTAIGLSSGVYNAEVEDATGCTNILAVTVDDSAGHSITVDSISDVSCPEKEDGAIHISVAGGNAPYTYEWSPSGNTDQDLENAPNGSHTVKVTDDTGCTKFLTDTIGKPEPLDVTRNIADASCGACDGSADLTVNGGTSPYTYEWSTGGSGPSETNICPGTHSVQITDAAGCENTIELSIENIEGPTIDGVNSDPVTCANTCDGAGEVFASGAGPLEYFWPSTGSNTNTSTGLCKGIHKVHVTDTNNCSSIAEVPVGGPQAIEDSAVVEHTNCGSCNGSVTAFASGGSPGYSYEWSNGDTSRSTDSLCSGTHTVIITDNAGCQDTASYNVNDSEAPTLSTTVNNVSCNDSCDGSASVSANGGIPPYNFTWLNATGNDTVGQGANISGLCPGDYVIRVEDDSGCATLETITIEEPEAIYFNPSLTRDVSCYGDCDGEATISFNGGTLPFDIQWDNGSDSATSTGLCAGSHKVVIRDDNGCMDSSFVTIDQPDSLTISIDSVLKASCPNTADGRIDITPNGGTQPYNYTWTGPNGFTSNMEDIDNLLPGKYIITVTDTNGCIRMDSAMVDPEVVVNAYAGQDTSYCEGKGPITLTGSGGTTQEWLDASGNTVGTGNSVIVDPAQTGPNIFVLVARNGPCTDRDTIIVTVYEKPVADAGPDKKIVDGKEVFIGGNPTGPPGSDYTWTPDSSISDPKVSNPAVNPEETTPYTVTVVSPEGCVNRDTVIVEVLPTVDPVDGFSPNGDGVNETWTIRNIEKFPDAVVKIYNRWGELLFRSKGYDEPWDGRYDGEPLPVGTYYYVIDLNDAGTEDVTGPVTILR